MANKSFSMMPLAGMDNAAQRDDALAVGGDARRIYLRDAVNMDISSTGKAQMRPGRRKVTDQALADLWQSPLHGDVFGRLGSEWVLVDRQSWDCTPLATIGDGQVSHIVLNNQVVAAGPTGLWRYDGAKAERLTLDAPPAPALAVQLGDGALEAGHYSVALAWLRGTQEGPLSAMVTAVVGERGALTVTLPLALDPTVTGMRLYHSRCNGGELLRGEDYPVGTTEVVVPLLPKLGAAAQWLHMEPMPAGLYLAYWRGRLVTATGNVLRFSEALAYHLHDPRHGVVQLPQRITFVQPVEGGLWVGQVDHVLFLVGTTLAELAVQRKASKPPVPGTAIALSAQDSGELSAGGRAVVAWLAGNGFVLGTADGSLVETQAKRIAGVHGQRGTCIGFGGRLLAVLQ